MSTVRNSSSSRMHLKIASLPEEIVAVVVEMAADRTRPPMSPQDVLQALARVGVPRLEDLVTEHLYDKGL